MSWAAVIAGGIAAAGGIASSAMGGGTEGGQVGSTSTLTPEQARLLTQLVNILGGELGQPGETPPGASQLQKQLFEALSGEKTGGVGDAIQAGSEYLDRLLSYDYDPSAGQEYWEKSFKKPMMQQWEQDIMPSIAEKYAGAGAISSSGFNRAMGQAGVNMQTQLGGQLSDVLYRGQQAHKARQMQGAGLSQQLAGLLGAAGGQQRNIGLQQWESQQPWGNPWLRFLSQALGTRAYDTYAQQPYQQTNLGAGAMSDLSMLASLYAYKNM